MNQDPRRRTLLVLQGFCYQQRHQTLFMQTVNRSQQSATVCILVIISCTFTCAVISTIFLGLYKSLQFSFGLISIKQLSKIYWMKLISFSFPMNLSFYLPDVLFVPLLNLFSVGILSTIPQCLVALYFVPRVQKQMCQRCYFTGKVLGLPEKLLAISLMFSDVSPGKPPLCAVSFEVS